MNDVCERPNRDYMPEHAVPDESSLVGKNAEYRIPDWVVGHCRTILRAGVLGISKHIALPAIYAGNVHSFPVRASCGTVRKLCSKMRAKYADYPDVDSG